MRILLILMSETKRVVIAMSGGVDSSVAAALLKKAGYDCTGVFMCFGQAPKGATSHPGCCSPQDANDAKDAAASLGIRFAILNFKDELEKIIDYFVDEYRGARTPNPCIMCNSQLKFGKLLQYADAMGADYVATGHYAQIRREANECRLARGIDADKDQSYALFNVWRESFEKILLPLGAYTKKQVRQIAAEANLAVKDKAESQEICFVADNDYASLVAARAPELCKAGRVVDSSGKVLGEHQGIFRFTIGQRRGLGIAMGKPMYVIGLDVKTNTVILGSREELFQNRLWAGNVNWLVNRPPSSPFEAIVQIRYNHRGAPATVVPESDQNVVVDFLQPVSAITPGQAAVFYDSDNNVIGGGWIARGEKI
jgi:tRNA-specific 2-thiouridylase